MDLSHLIPASRATAKLTDAQRIKQIKADRWIGYPRAKQALERLEELFYIQSKQRMPNLLIVGPTNNGKSMIIEKFRRMHPVKERNEDVLDEMPVVVLQMPSEPGVARFYAMLLSALGSSSFTRTRAVQLEDIALNRMRRMESRILIIDELHNMLAGNSAEQREFLNLLRFLGNELRIPLVGVGTRDAYLAIRSDDQLENRFEPFLLPKWEENNDLLTLLASFAAAFPLRLPSKLASRKTAAYILARTEGTIGEIAAFLSAAAVEAVESGEECINPKTMEHAKYQAPSERRRTFERALV